MNLKTRIEKLEANRGKTCDYPEFVVIKPGEPPNICPKCIQNIRKGLAAFSLALPSLEVKE
jgi:hypothetical protein